jgi:uncharacterized membrane protein SpoIIM required for sporulation
LKETTFIEKNEGDWRKLESLLRAGNTNADELLHLFEKVSGDLAYARTYFPNRSIRIYLNNLTQQVLNKLVKKRDKFSINSIVDFYRKTLPTEIYRSRKAFIASFLVFAVAIMIGVVSSANVDNFANIVLGDDYVTMTQENINDGDPMAVYKGDSQGNMFMRITLNNIRVSFLCFVLGLLGSFGTIFVLLSNGIMVGTFQYYFYQKGLFATSFLTIWIHGTIEISAIILAGAAGFILGNGLLFPKTFSRNSSLLLSAKRSLRIILALMPLFVIAGFLESFVTRLTGMPTIVKILIIGLSAAFILFTFVIYPIYCARNGLLDYDAIKVDPIDFENIETNKYSYQTFGTTFASALGLMRESFGPYMTRVFIPGILLIGLTTYLLLKYRIMATIGVPSDLNLLGLDISLWPFILSLVLITLLMFTWLIVWSQGKTVNRANIFSTIKRYILPLSLLSTIFTFGYYYMLAPLPYVETRLLWLTLLIFPIHYIFIIFEEVSQGKKLTFEFLKNRFGFSYKNWFNFLPITLGIIVYFLLMSLVKVSAVSRFLLDFISWHNIFNHNLADSIYVNNLLSMLIYLLPIPFMYFAYTYRYCSLSSLNESNDLIERMQSFGDKEKRYYLGS